MNFNVRPVVSGLAVFVMLLLVAGQNSAQGVQGEVVVDFTGLNPLPPPTEPVKIDIAIPSSVYNATPRPLPLELSVVSVGVSGPRNDRAFDMEIRIRNTGQTPFLLPVSPLSLDKNRIALEPNNKGRRTAAITVLVQDPKTRLRSQVGGILLAGSPTLPNSVRELRPGNSALIRFRAPFSLDELMENVDVAAKLLVGTIEDGPGETQTMGERWAELLSINYLNRSLR